MSHPCARSFLVVLLGLASLMAVAHAQSPPVPAYRSFKDWVVGCDNTRSCTAVGMQPEGQGTFVQVEREGGGQARVRVRFALLDEEFTPDEPIVVTVDGTPVPGMASSRPVHDRDGDHSMILLDEGEVAPFLDAVRRGRRLRLAPASGEAAEVSLEGAVAALVFMDDAQGRVGTATALIRRGAKPESAVPVPPPLPRVRAFRVPQGAEAEADPRLVQIIRERLLREEPDACDPPEYIRAPSGDTTAPLGSDKMLVTIPCTGGAYNFGYRHYIVEGGNAAGAKPAVFPVPEEAQEERQLFNSSFEPKTGLLSFLSKWRGGLPECGRSGEYAWTGERFLPVTYHVMGECRGVPEPYWPALWRAELE